MYSVERNRKPVDTSNVTTYVNLSHDEEAGLELLIYKLLTQVHYWGTYPSMTIAGH